MFESFIDSPPLNLGGYSTVYTVGQTRVAKTMTGTYANCSIEKFFSLTSDFFYIPNILKFL